MFYCKTRQIEQEIKKLNDKKRMLARKFVIDHSNLKVEVFFKTMYRIFGQSITLRWYNKAYYNCKDIVRAREELKALVADKKNGP